MALPLRYASPQPVMKLISLSLYISLSLSLSLYFVLILILLSLSLALFSTESISICIYLYQSLAPSIFRSEYVLQFCFIAMMFLAMHYA